MGRRIVSVAYSVAVIRMVPAGFVPKFAYRVEFGFDLLDTRCGSANKTFAGLGQGNAARGARQQANSKPLLEMTDGLAQCRLRDAELCGRLREALLAIDRDERTEIVQTSSFHLFALLMSLCRL